MNGLFFTTSTSQSAIDRKGQIQSIKLNDGSELIRKKIPLITAELQDGSILEKGDVSFPEKDVIRFCWGDACSASVKIENTGSYLRFRVENCSVPGLKTLNFCRVAPRCTAYYGRMGGMYSDEKNMVCLRSISLKSSVDPGPESRILTGFAEAEHLCSQSCCALIAAPREEMIPILKELTEKEAVPKSVSGGAWVLESERARRSYIFADLRADETEQWIRLARMGYFGFLHIHGWWNTLGHYDINRNFFPGGIEQMKEAVEKIHAAGLYASFHTLTACLEPDDAWISPEPVEDLISCARYTLAQDAAPEDEVIYVNEKPIDGHELVWSYTCNSNVIKVGKELFQYEEVSYEKPYCFKKCQRGAFNTRALAHKAGAEASYLQSRYLAFYPEPDGKTADALADGIAEKYRYLNLDGIYLDGSEGMRSRYGTDAMRWKIFSRLPENAVVEASNWNHNNWYFHSRLGAWDHTAWAMRRNHEAHVKQIAHVKKSNLLQPQLGWWAARGPFPGCRGQFVDELEYYAMKNLAFDAPSSLQELRAGQGQWNDRIFDMLTRHGWYERFRVAQYFREEDLKVLQQVEKDFILRMNDRGSWQLYPRQTVKLRLPEQPGPVSFQVVSKHPAQNLTARLEALYVLDQQAPGSKQITAFSDSSTIARKESAAQVSLETTAVAPDKQHDFARMRLEITNRSRRCNGAWAVAGIHYPHPYLSVENCGGFGLWIKGDRSNALLNIQFRCPVQFKNATSDHYIKLDFEGWRFCTFLFRERDAEFMSDNKWPYSTSAGDLLNTRCLLNLEHISEVNLFVNKVPIQGKTVVEVSDITVFKQCQTVYRDIVLACNGSTFSLPVEMNSGDYIELEDNCGVRYSEQGRLLERFALPLLPVKKGKNQFTLASRTASGCPSRFEFTLFTAGTAFGKRSAGVQWEHLQEEFAIPRIILQENGIDNRWDLMRRNEKAAVNNDPQLFFQLDVESAGILEQSGLVIDAGQDPENYRNKEGNHYGVYLPDGSKEVVAKSGIQCTVSRVAGSGPVRMDAVSVRGGDHTGWAAMGRHFEKPLDLSAYGGVGIRLRSSLSSGSFKVHLVDQNHRTAEFSMQLCDSAWHQEDFPIDKGSGVDFSKIICIIYSINDIMCCSSAWVEIDQVSALPRHARLHQPVLTIGKNKITFPCSLAAGDCLRCTGQQEFTVVNASGKEVFSGRSDGVFPKLKPGKNPVQLNFKEKDCSHFRLTAWIIKKY